MKKKTYILLNLFILIFICISIVFFGRHLIVEKEKELLHEKYKAISQNIKNKTNSLIQTKKNATLAIALVLSENEAIKDILLDNENNTYDLKKLSEKIRIYTDYKNVWFQLITNEGISVYRSWTNNKNDKIKNYRLDLTTLLANPIIKNTISVGVYDITFKSIIPLYRNNEFIGVLEGITHFNSITEDLKNNDKVEPIILVNSRFTKQLEEKNFTKIFLQDYYVANLTASKEIINYLKYENMNKFFQENEYLIKDEKLIINIPIIEEGINLANILIFKNLDEIDISEINEFKKHSFYYLIFFLIFIYLSIFIIAYYLYSKRLKELNISLQKTIEYEIMKNDEKNRILFQQNKMAAMGEMIGNIAHQWRQPLSVITVLASSLKVKKELDILEEKDYLESYNLILETANYLSNTIDDFQYYFSPNKNKNSFNTKNLIDKSLKLSSMEFKEHNINVIKNIEEFEALNFENELLQVVINILNNAKDELIKKDAKRYIFIDLFKEDKNIIIKIKDNAGGIDKNVIDRVFEPYFTTKHKSKGTGIGLYMCQEIIVKHIEGTIQVSNEIYEYENEEFIGAKFEITLAL
ncbi:MAG: HAMP domain-containing histidine kinase [Aliarcobacter sp.]|nr:HAMP domain-containing histidine kinase [Aliarcobacter sp.]MBP6712535.1 HAMP domain-containing histidine kinase [Aliarcobacter sp.]MBP7225511.1 HAMP domain-containing histidine kinase [Aliarcobacter sp.]